MPSFISSLQFFKMNVEHIDDVTIISTDSRVDSLDGPKLKDTVRELAQGQCLNLVIDMGKTIFLDSSGCGGLVSALKTLCSQDGDLKIARPTPRVIEVLQLTRLHRVFQIYDSVESAIKSFH
jgi:anti-sigma B factor antagonist